MAVAYAEDLLCARSLRNSKMSILAIIFQKLYLRPSQEIVERDCRLP